MNLLKKRILEECKKCSLSSPIYSTQATVKSIKSDFWINDKQLCEVLLEMYNNGEIKEFGLRRSEWNPEVLSFYWFK